MKRIVQSSLIGALGLGALLLFTSSGAFAATLTPSGTTVSNTATVNYKVNNIDQTAVLSAPNGTAAPGTATDFVVDKLLDLSVAKQDTGFVTTTPGASSSVTTFKVQNNGNDAQSAYLVATAEAVGTASPFSSTSGNSAFAVSSTAMYLESNGTAGYQATDTPISVGGNIPTLAANGASAVVYILADMPSTPTDGQFAVVSLVAQVGVNNSGGAITSDDASAAWTPGTVQKIFAEISNSGFGGDTAAYNGYAGADSGYQINTATLSIIKSASVVSDPVSDPASGNAPAGYKPKAIPGAVIMYTITVSNSGGTQATDISITDNLSTQTNLDLTGTSASITAADDYSGTPGTNLCVGGGGHGTGSVQCAYSAGTVTVSGLTVSAGNSAQVTFTVKIK